MTVTILRDPGGAALAQFTTGGRIPVTAFFDGEGQFNAPAHNGMSSDITVYKQLIRERVNAMLKTRSVITKTANVQSGQH